MRQIRLFVLYSLIVVFALPVFAQEQAGLDIAVLKAGVGARPLGMGSAFTAIADNADAPYWNPAGLGFVNKHEITSTQTKLSTDADHLYLSYIMPAMGGSLGISWIQIGMGNLIQTSSEVDNNNEVINLNGFSYFANAYLLAYGRKLNEHISLGITGTYLFSDMSNISGGQAYGYSISPGLLLKFDLKDAKLSIGAKIDDLINQQNWTSGSLEQAPSKFRLGLAFAKSNLGLFSVDVCQILRSNYSTTMSIGYEWAKDPLSLRLGYAESGFTAGVGFISGVVRVDYAYVVQQELRNNVHRISLSGIWQ